MNRNSFHETKPHGKLTFPYIVYRGNFPEYIRSYPLHWHDEMEFIYIADGQGCVTVHSHRYTVQTGDILLIPPQTIHSMEQMDHHHMEYFNILFRFSLLSSSAEDTCYQKYFKPVYDHSRSIPYYLPAGDARNKLLLPHISYLVENRRKRYTEDELMVKSHLFALMHHAYRFSTDITSTEQSMENTYDKLKKLLLYVQKNYASSLTVEQAAEMCSFSKSHFMKLFKELTGKSFAQYRKDYRLEQAALRLEQSRCKIIDVAADTGFHNLSYFTRAFAEQYGVTPSQYRQSHGRQVPS